MLKQIKTYAKAFLAPFIYSLIIAILVFIARWSRMDFGAFPPSWLEMSIFIIIGGTTAGGLGYLSALDTKGK